MPFGKFLMIAVVSAAGLLALGGTGARAQDQQADNPSKPRPAGRAYPPNLDEDPSGDRDLSLLQPDAGPLTGVQTPTLGSLEAGHSYLVSGLQYSNVIRSTALNQATAAGWNSTNYVAATGTLLRLWSNSQLSINYIGGGYFSSDKTQGNGYFHQFGLTQTFQRQRWQFTLFDQSFYLPETAFGFGVGIGVFADTNLSSTQPGIKNNYQPNQSILTLTGSRFSNTAAAQASYALSPRSSINVGGSYGVLRFTRAGNIDTDDAILNVGYNYEISEKNTLGVLYRLTAYRYPGNPQGLNEHVVQAAFGRKITGRLALQLFVGPQITTFRLPVESASHNVGGSGAVTLDYASGLNDLSVTYSHGLANGSGVQFGSSNDQVETQFARKFARRWRASAYFEFAQNRSIGNPGLGQNSQDFNSYYAGGDLVRTVSHDSDLAVGYAALIQTSRLPVCAAGACGTNFKQHQVTLQFLWHTRPFVLR